MLDHGLQEVQAILHIIAHILQGLLDRFPHERVGGKVHDSIKAPRPKKAGQSLHITQITLDKLGLG